MGRFDAQEESFKREQPLLQKASSRTLGLGAACAAERRSGQANPAASRRRRLARRSCASQGTFPAEIEAAGKYPRARRLQPPAEILQALLHLLIKSRNFES